MNQIFFIGNLTRDPEQRSLVTGKSLVEFNVAVDRNYSKGEDRKTDYFRCVVFGEFGKTCMKALYKGAYVFVCGELNPYIYTRNDGGQGVTLNVTAEKVKFLSPRKDRDGGNATTAEAGMDQFTDLDAGDIPF